MNMWTQCGLFNSEGYVVKSLPSKLIKTIAPIIYEKNIVLIQCGVSVFISKIGDLGSITNKKKETRLYWRFSNFLFV